MTAVKLIYSLLIIFLAGRALLGFKCFNVSDEPVWARLSLYFFAGSGVVGFYMFILSMIGLKFNIAIISLPFIIYLLLNIKLITSFKLPSFKWPEVRSFILGVSLLMLAAMCAAMLLDGLVSPIFSKDAFSMWFLKAKMIFFERHIPFEIFKLPFYVYSSPEYPLLAPLDLAWISFCLGQWNDVLLRVYFIMQYVLFIPFLYSSLKRYISKEMSALGCLVLMANKHVLVYAANGYLDLMVGMFAAISVIYLLRWMDEQSESGLFLSAFFMGCAAFTKNDGIALFLALVLSLALFLVIFRGRTDIRNALSGFFGFIAVGGAVFIPYQIVSRSYHISSHMIKDSNIIAATINNIGRAPQIAGHFLYQLYCNTYDWQYLWIFMTILLITGWRKIKSSNLKFILLFLFIALALYFEVYMLTVADNLTSSFHRLLIGLAPTAVFLAFSSGLMEET